MTSDREAACGIAFFVGLIALFIGWSAIEIGETPGHVAIVRRENIADVYSNRG